MRGDLKSQDSHFAFGKNWASFSEQLNEPQVERAVTDLRRLLGGDLRGRSFLDIGCGSAIHSVAALRLGAKHVFAVDIDPDSVATTQAVLSRFAPNSAYRVEERSVFDLNSARDGTADVVYSWGVLHHTGDLNGALRSAANMVAPGGQFLFALYRRTYLCPFWRLEKQWYKSASARAQRLAQHLYLDWYQALSVARRLTHGEPPSLCDGARGMDLRHDLHDWLGGFPYESILPRDVERLMRQEGFRHEASFLCARKAGRTHGLLGSGCDEYRYSRVKPVAVNAGAVAH